MAAEWACQAGALRRVAQAGGRRHGEVLLPQPHGPERVVVIGEDFDHDHEAVAASL
jgi:hypothetical protein